MFGHIQGVDAGANFESRRELHDAGVHRGLMQGIAPLGASIVLNGGYVDDVDEGDLIIYTGQGGNDASTGRQIADQTLTRGNALLANNYREGNPIRVVRGFNLDSEYKTSSGYRYDGLYRVEDFWSETGEDGFLVWRFRLIRHTEQIPIESNKDQRGPASISLDGLGSEAPERTSVTTSRVIRNSQVGNKVKELYDHQCQVCGTKLMTPTGPYAECCHIRPLGRPHNGPDTLDNVLCLCPNCHVLFDNHAIMIQDDMSMRGLSGALAIAPGHDININHLKYHQKISRSS